MNSSSSSTHSWTATRAGQRFLLERRPCEIWSPKSPAQVSAVLSAELGTEQISPLENIVRDGEWGNRERSLVIASRDAGHSPWRFVFKGSMRAGADGTWLTGVVGPSSAVLLFVLGWMSVVSLFLLSGIVTVVVNLISGQRTLVVAWLLVPAAVLIATYVIHQAAVASAEVRWRATDQWLRELVDAPGST